PARRGETRRTRGPAPGDEEDRVAAPRREPAAVAARELAAREAERGARAAADVGAVAFLARVDRAVPGERAVGCVDVTLIAREVAAREAERGARLPGERRAVALLALRDEAVAA